MGKRREYELRKRVDIIPELMREKRRWRISERGL